jgi:metal-responsive CopG/Arc/MetJ family transcriptional regulator
MPQAPARRPLTGSRNWTITMPDELLDFLDTEAQRRCCSRSAYLRWLIVQAMEQARRSA